MFNDFTPGFLDRVKIRQDDATQMILNEGVRHFFEQRILNADETLFTARETQQIKRKAYFVKYPEFKADQLVPVDTEGDTGSDSLGFDIFDRQGEAEVVNDRADDYPEVDITKDQQVAPVLTIGDRVSWGLQDVRRATLAASRSGISSSYSFTQLKTEAAVKAIRLKEERIIAQGDDKVGLVGFFNNSLIPSVTPTTATSFKAQTPTQKLQLLNELVNSVEEKSQGLFIPNTLLCSIPFYRDIASTPYTGDHGTAVETVLSFFLTKAQVDKPDFKVIPYARLNWGLPVGERTTHHLNIVYKRNPEVLQQQIPQPMEVFGPTSENGGLKFTVRMRERHGGVHLRYPPGTASLKILV